MGWRRGGCAAVRNTIKVVLLGNKSFFMLGRAPWKGIKRVIESNEKEKENVG
jgi:hypothetical protein